jgi:tetratricopeptide (TPR) repeat protein
MSRRASILDRRGVVVALAAVAGALAALFGASTTESRESAPVETRTAYDEALADLDRRVDTAERFADAQPSSWIRRGEVASLYLGRARLTGAYSDYERAEEALARAFAHARDGSGPLLARASLHASLHRYDAALADLARIRSHALRPPAQLAEARGLAGDVALDRGRYGEARALYEESLALHRSFDGCSRLASYHSAIGEIDRAAELYREAEATLVPSERHLHAIVAVRLGELAIERGDLPEARAQYERADRFFAGFWVVEQHLADLAEREGRRGEAIARYEAIAARTGSLEAMDAAAMLHLRSADRAAAAQWLERAGREYERRLARFPDATAGHAVQHFLLRRDYGRALELAERDVGQRPGGPARARRAEVLRAMGRPHRARAEVDALLATPFRSRALSDLANALR